MPNRDVVYRQSVVYHLWLAAAVVLLVVAAYLAGRCCAPSRADGFASCDDAAVKRIRLLRGAGAVAPEACRKVGDWLVFRSTWLDAPGRDIKGSPRARMTPAACQALCAADPSCVSWSNNENAYCHAYSIVPTVAAGNTQSVSGVRASAV